MVQITKFEYLQPIHLNANLNVPPMCFLSEGLLNWHIPEYTNPQSCNKPSLQSGHHCTKNSYTACSEWSGNSHLGICSASQSMDGTCICGESCPLQGLCSTSVWVWVCQPWHLSMAVDFNVSTEGSNCRKARPDWQHIPQHTHTHLSAHTHNTHIHLYSFHTERGHNNSTNSMCYQRREN